MQRVTRRLDKLDAILDPPKQPHKLFRVVVSRVSPGTLANSTCTRTLRQGTLMEIVTLKGSCEDQTEEELEQFIQSFPIDEPVT